MVIVLHKFTANFYKWVFCMLYSLLDSFEVLSHWVRCLLLLRQIKVITQHCVVCCAINNMAAEELESSELIQLAETHGLLDCFGFKL